jgi:hypothetical protein
VTNRLDCLARLKKDERAHRSDRDWNLRLWHAWCFPRQGSLTCDGSSAKRFLTLRSRSELEYPQETNLLSDLLPALDGNSLATLAPTFLTKVERLIADP